MQWHQRPAQETADFTPDFGVADRLFPAPTPGGGGVKIANIHQSNCSLRRTPLTFGCTANTVVRRPSSTEGSKPVVEREPEYIISEAMCPSTLNQDV